jgi:hypothetical protein
MELEIYGIKCDTKHCNYRDDNVQFEDYPNWIDKPCPVCGGNLLTQKNYESCLRMKKIARLITALRWINPIFYLKSLYKLITKKSLDENLQIKFENDGSITKRKYKSE